MTADVKLVVFDLDGTLVDSRRDIVTAFNEGLRSVGAEPFSDDEIQTRVSPLIGMPLNQMYELVLGDGDAARVEAGCAAYRAYYFEHCADHTLFFPGVLTGLDRLAPIPLAVATTKKTFMAVKLLELLGQQDRFALIQGTDGIPPKPDPAILHQVADTLGVPASKAWMVGDTVHDIAAAKRAGMLACGVTYGGATGADLEAAGADCLVGSLERFAAHLEAKG